MGFYDTYRWRDLLLPHIFIYGVLTVIIIGFVVLTIIFGVLWGKSESKLEALSSNTAANSGIIGSRPRLPNDGRYVQWTFLHMNDIYELLPLDQNQKGGLARVAYIRRLLLNENSNTITFLAGDLVSPSAIGTAEVNGTELNGKQMIATMNTLGLDYITFGNHEFDLKKNELLARMNESKFTWISSNVFNINDSNPFGSSITHKLITIDTVRILIIAYTINVTCNYVRFIDESSLVNYTKQFLLSFPRGTYDILVALTHLDMPFDIQLAENIPEIDLIMGGHEHENYYYLRGADYTPIYKADANDFTVYIHRCAFNIDTKRFRIYSTLAKVSPEVPEDEQTATVANYWFNLGIEGFRTLGYNPSEIVSCLSNGVELDGRYESTTSSNTLLTDAVCESLVKATASFSTTVGLIFGGTIRIDDLLRGTITQYDILRTLPFPDVIVVLSVPGDLLAQALTTGLTFKGTGMFIDYTGVETSDGGSTWLANGMNIASSSLTYKVAATDYLRDNTALNSTRVSTLQTTDVTQAKALIDYLKIKYPC